MHNSCDVMQKMCTTPSQTKKKKKKPSIKRGYGDKVPLLEEELLMIDSCKERGSQFSLGV